MLLDETDAVRCCRELYGRELELALAEYIVAELLDQGYTDTDEIDQEAADRVRRAAGDDTGIGLKDM
ncbi:hypothetical protein UFOVP411_37 [uncultured Caudovirales phage]|uniref:Uncharacterized protein n=1 Tax=uncultured Caudovirales phage TaxID=2100421 RepID=A0A6J5M6H3_9CAUD|nr:hypothetical protein UFOVP411_37 [uncultured Caudovirales phage]